MKTEKISCLDLFGGVEKKAFAFFLLSAWMSILIVSDADAAMDTVVAKDTITFGVSTVDHIDWYDDRCTNKKDDDGDGFTDGADKAAPVCDGGDSGLSPQVVCDGGDKESDGYFVTDPKTKTLPTDLSMSPCDRDEVHDDYYSTSASNEIYVQPSDKNFSIRVNASDPSGIDSIRIEWISGAKRDREAGSYWDPDKLALYQKEDVALNPHKSAFTCMNATVCEICVVGGSCANPVIPTGDLGNTGAQQIILMRAVITDGAMNTIATGFDDDKSTSPVLDKFYRFVICSSSCNTNPDKCVNDNPKATLLRYEKQFACEGPVYTLYWQFEDTDKNSKPSSYILEVRDRSNPDIIYSAVRTAKDGLTCIDTCGCDGYYTKCEMYATLFKGFLQTSDGKPVNIDYGNKTYDWRVKVYDNSSEKYCVGVSDWTPWSSQMNPDLSFTTSYPGPKASFDMMNPGGLDCSTAGVCKYGEDILFSSTSTVDPKTSIAAYEWFIDGVKVGSVDSSSITKNFTEGSSERTVSLSVTDKQGVKCSAQQEISLGGTIPGAGENAGWNEINPGKEY